MNLKMLKKLPWRWRGILTLVAIGWIINIWREARVPMPEGIEMKRMPAIVEMEPSEINARLDAMQRRGITPEIRCRRLAMRDLGLISHVEPSIVAPDDSWLNRAQRRLTEKARVEAFYVVGRDTLYTLYKRSPAVKHEMMHAWEDQVADRMKLAQSATTDEQIALRAVIEGTAILGANQNHGSFVLGNNLDDNAWSLAYSQGPRHVIRFGQRDPEKWLEVRPQTTYDILYERRGTAPTELDADSAQAPVACSDRLGPLGVLTAALAWGMERPLALRASEKWRGDKMIVWQDADAMRQVRWDVIFADSLSTSDWSHTVKTTQTLPKERVIVYGRTTARTLALTSKDTLAKRTPLDQ